MSLLNLAPFALLILTLGTIIYYVLPALRTWHTIQAAQVWIANYRTKRVLRRYVARWEPTTRSNP